MTMGLIVVAIWFLLCVAVFVGADQIARAMQRLDRSLNGWIWGRGDGWPPDGRRTFFRWGLRIWALAAFAMLVTVLAIETT